MASQDDIPKRWCGFPGEIRNQIYEELLRQPEGIHIEDCMSLRPRSRAPIHLDILRTDRQTYNEVLTYLFEINLLYLDISPRRAMEFLQSIPDVARMKIKSLVLEPESAPDCCTMSQNFCDYLTKEMALNTLTIQFNYPEYNRIFGKYPARWCFRSFDVVTIGRVTLALMNKKINKVRLYYPRLDEIHEEIEDYRHIRTMRHIGVDRINWFWRDTVIHWKSRGFATKEELAAEIPELLEKYHWDFVARFGSHQVGETGTVLELTRKGVDEES